MSICVYVCACVRLGARMCILCVDMCMCACVCVYVCMCVYVYVCMYVCANMCAFLRMYVSEGCNKWLRQLIPLFAAERSDEYFSVGLRISSAETTEVTLTVCFSS